MLQRIVAIVAAGVLVAACGGTTTNEPGAGDGQAAEKREETTKTKAPPTTTKAQATHGKNTRRGDREPAETPEPTTEPVRYYPVTQVVDGDTVKVARQGETTIRIIGIDTPETVDPNSPVECFGPEASARAHQLLDGQDVRLVFDPSQGRKDYYDRTLAYLETRGGADFGRTMVREGFAAEYTYDTAYQRQDSYQAAEQEARAANRGLWAKCGGPHKAPSAPETTPEPETTEPDSGGNGSGGGGGAGGCADGYDPCIPPLPPDVNCDDVDGPITVTGSDPHGLDADGDGVACES